MRSTVITALPGATGPPGVERPSADEPDTTQPRRTPVASFTKLIKDFARSPKGRQLIDQAKEQASKPENRRKLEELRRRYVKR